MPDESPTLDQTVALSRVGKAYDSFARKIRQALQVGVRPESIIDFLDSPEVQITNRVMRKVIEREVIIEGEEADTLDDGTKLVIADDEADTEVFDVIDEANEDTVIRKPDE